MKAVMTKEDYEKTEEFRTEMAELGNIRTNGEIWLQQFNQANNEKEYQDMKKLHEFQLM